MSKTKGEKEIQADAVEVLEELTPDEERERHRLELKVERAFFEAGKALAALRDQRLYRSTHKTFEEYCHDRFGFTRFSAYNKIAAASVFENLLTIGQQILPVNERQVRDLSSLEPDEQREVWQQAVEAAGNKVPSGRIVKEIVEQLKEKPLFLTTDFCQIGNVFTLIRLEGYERRYNGYPCVAVELKHFTVEVEVYDGTLLVKPENLTPIDSLDVRRQLPAILQRIRRLRRCELDRGVYPILESLGRQTYLTDFEADLLAFVEQRYQITN